MWIRWFAGMILVAGAAYGQVRAGSVSGTVVDVTGSQIPGAVVTIESPMPMAGATTGQTGEFKIDGVPPGNYSLVIQAAEFRTKELDVQIEDDKETRVGPVMLDLAPLPPCLGEMKSPIFRETKVLLGGKSRVFGTALEGGRH